MSRFTEVLLVSPLADGKTWIVSRDFGYEVGSEGSGDMVDVAVGFQTDFASIPRVFWIVLPKWGRYGNASVIHDWLYWFQSRLRREADDIFLEAMGILDVGSVKKHTIYWAVRIFGRIAWLRNQADRAAGFDRVSELEVLKATAESNRKGTLGRLTRHALRKVSGRSSS
jgi:hypothetical protein